MEPADKDVSILLVDDDTRNLDALESILSGNNYRLCRAHNGNEALLALVREDFAVIVLDIRLPDITGLDLAKMIKQRRKTQHIPIIFLTAYYQEDSDILLGYGAGAVDYLSKPVNPLILRSKVEVFVELFQKTRALAHMNREMEAEIDRRLGQLAASLAEKEILLKEIHHRVKNNLQIVSSLLSLQAEKMPDQAQRALFQAARDRVQSMALVHETLYRSPDLARTDLGEYIRSLMNHLFQVYGDRRIGVDLKLDLLEVLLPIDSAIPCGLILNELVTNALKHAFVGRDSGRITIELARTSDDQVSLTVEDDGRGLPEQFDWRKSESLGLRLITMLSDQLNAHLQIANGNGTRARLTFAVPRREHDGPRAG